MTSSLDRIDNTKKPEMRIFLCMKDTELADRLAQETRRRGYKSRIFHNLEVMANASMVLPPDLIVVEDALLLSSRAQVETQGGAASVSAQHADEEDFKVIKDYILPVVENALEPIPMIYISEDDSFHTRVKSIEYGFNAFFHKPVNISSFLNRIHHLLQRKSFSADNVILMSDGSSLVENFAEDFKNEGMILTECFNVGDVLVQLEKVNPVLVLINGDMEQYPASAIASVIRQEERFFTLPIMIISHRDKKIFDSAAADYGIEDVVGLPIGTEDLIPICRSHIMRAKNLKYEYEYLTKRDSMTGLYNASYLFEKISELVSSVKPRTMCGGLIYVSLTTASIPDGQDPVEAERAIAVELGNEWTNVILPPHIPAKIDQHTYAVMVYGEEERLVEHQTDQIKYTMQKLKVQINSSDIKINSTIGVTYFDGQVLDVHEILKRARAASEMGALSSAAGKSASEWVDYWAEEIKKALEEDRFHLLYQPLANLSGEPQSFFEIFLRMRNEFDTDIMPSEFLSAAMENGLDAKIDRWVIEQACGLIASQAKMGPAPRFFVKLFPGSIGDRTLLPFVKNQLTKTGIDPSCLALQMTEVGAEMQMGQAAALAKALRELGVMVVIEHVGQGADYLDVLKQVPFDYAKIDGALVADVYRNSKNHELVYAITEKAHALGGKVIAPQVEEAACLSVLFQSGVDYIQGNFMQPPGDVFLLS